MEDRSTITSLYSNHKSLCAWSTKLRRNVSQIKTSFFIQHTDSSPVVYNYNDVQMFITGKSASSLNWSSYQKCMCSSISNSVWLHGRSSSHNEILLIKFSLDSTLTSHILTVCSRRKCKYLFRCLFRPWYRDDYRLNPSLNWGRSASCTLHSPLYRKRSSRTLIQTTFRLNMR